MKLQESLTLSNGQILENRVVKAAMAESLGDKKGVPLPSLFALYKIWAQSGSGLLLSGNVMVDSNHLGNLGDIVLEKGCDLAPFEKWAQIGKEQKSPIWLQLNHPGRQALASKGQPVAPSPIAVKGFGPVFKTPQELTSLQIEGIIERFANAAAMAKQAGFEGVQIHGAHGYLVSQFLSPSSNQRSDSWGGTVENRARFLLQIIRKIREQVGESFGLALKLNSADFQKGGFSEEDCQQVIQMLNHENIQFLEISGGTYEKPAMMDLSLHAKSTQKREAFFLEFATTARTISKHPFMLTGGMRTLDGMNHALESKAIDLVGIARPMITEPLLPRELMDGKKQQATEIVFAKAPKWLQHSTEQLWYLILLQDLGLYGKNNPKEIRLKTIFKHLWRLLFGK